VYLPDVNREEIPHGVWNFLKILVYLKNTGRTEGRELGRVISLGRQILGWKELHPYEKTMGRIIFEPVHIRPRDDDERVALETCHTVWYVRRVFSVFGRGFGLQILKRNLNALPLYVRANLLKIDAASVHQNFKSTAVLGLPSVWRLDVVKTPSLLQKAVRGGELVVQDLSGIVAGVVASPQAEDTVLDICAAPGNKTSHIAAFMENDGRIFSVDISAERMANWKREMTRTGCLIAHPIVSDARKLELNIQADMVIVDPPCSNTGVFAKNPSAKWSISPSRLNVLSIRQFAILQSASRYVRSGGSLIYCTCSILPEENEDVLAEFLHRNPDFHVVRQKPFLGLPGLKGFDGCQRFFSHLHGCNGYFIAKLRKG
jgi:16S rRNA (cytosine967-C5)-methyltransferase